MDILLFGIQGSGKGTQAKALALALNFPIFEAGAELRSLATKDTPAGNEIRSIINKGGLVPPGIILLRIADFLDNAAAIQGVIFDGVPRSYDQAVSFDEMITQKHRESLAINIELDEDEAITRLEKRRICSKCNAIFLPDYQNTICNLCGGLLIHRADDNPESIKVRFAKYKQETLPVIDHYRKQGKVLTVDGNQAVMDVTKDIFNQLSPLLKLKTKQSNKLLADLIKAS
ncbi:MAG: nucleoside monophosphate kinase [Candidatus Abawacabacteria bacterium]|nr:nucleoside monophosphate kinase [Candidatus Abawacabacteria bacterium]